MLNRPHKILLVEPDARMLELIVASLARRLNARITCVADGRSCLDIDTLEPHDLVITELTLPDKDGLELAERLMASSRRPVILLAEEPTCDEAIEAMRLGVVDLLRKPLHIERLIEVVQHALRDFELRRRRAAKYRRMRDLVRRIIRERRQLNRRIELICRDLVGAHRRLVHRVLALEEKHAQQQLH